MTLRANITTTYQEVNANPPRANKNAQKKAADQGVHESEGTRKPTKPALKTTNRGGVPLTEQSGDRSAARNSGQTSATLDVFKRSSPEDKSTAANRSQKMQSGSMINKVATFEPSKSDESQETSSDDKPKAPKSLSRSLPIATPPKIRLAGASAKAATDNALASFSNVDPAPASVSAKKSDQSPSGAATGPVFNSPDEDTMQSILTTALRTGQTQGDNSQSNSASGIDVAKHLQSEGVFGISASGRNLGAIDFIRQKQFEYSMDQKPFTTDDLLLEAEKAIHETLNSDQSSSVSKSLLQAAESINAYRNQSAKSSEQAEIAAKPERVTAPTGKSKA